MSIESVMPSNLLSLCRPLLLLPGRQEGSMRRQRRRESLNKSILSGRLNHNDSDSVSVPEWLVFSGCALVCHSSFQKDQTKMQTSYTANLVSLTEITGCWPTSSVPVFYLGSQLTLFPNLFLQVGTAIWKFYPMKSDRMLIYFTSKFLREEISFLSSMPSISCSRWWPRFLGFDRLSRGKMPESLSHRVEQSCPVASNIKLALLLTQE